MVLSVRDMAALLGCSETAIYRKLNLSHYYVRLAAAVAPRF
jgi:predicted DNA-binding transcriptional regulator AlpA